MPGKKKTEPVNWEEYNRRIDLFSSAFRKIQEGGEGLSQEEKRSGKNLTSLVWTFSPVKNAVAIV